MDITETSKELKELGIMIDQVKKRLANQIPLLVENNISEFDLSKISLMLSSLPRYSRGLIEISERLRLLPKGM